MENAPTVEVHQPTLKIPGTGAIEAKVLFFKLNGTFQENSTEKVRIFTLLVGDRKIRVVFQPDSPEENWPEEYGSRRAFRAIEDYQTIIITEWDSVQVLVKPRGRLPRWKTYPYIKAFSVPPGPSTSSPGPSNSSLRLRL